jgi:hypothetical protein
MEYAELPLPARKALFKLSLHQRPSKSFFLLFEGKNGDRKNQEKVQK